LNQRIGYYLVLPLLIIIAYLPFPLLYAFSRFLNFVIADLIGYRKKVVLENLRHAFPEKSEEEIYAISRKFYAFFSDFILETIKMYSISPKELKKRIPFENVELLTPEYDKNQSIIVVLGHFGNWEWAGPGACVQLPFVFQPVYKRLLNPYFDRFVLHIRSRLGPEMLEMRTVARKMVQDKDRCTITIFPMDQRPDPNHAYWTTFMNRDAGFFQGPEKLGKKLNYPIYYVTVGRKSRGQYYLRMSEVELHPQKSAEGEITEKMIRLLEKDIREQPELYLWSHKRWKHKRPI
jgi:KDO2-lipid IV(A) lauroyltransferase